METEMDRMLQGIKEVEESQDFDRAMCFIKYLAWKAIEKNAWERMVKKATAKACGEEKLAEILLEASKEHVKGCYLTEKEKEIYDELFTIWD